MRSILLLVLALLCWYLKSSYAQSPQVLEATLDTMLYTLDQSQVPTGIFYDKVPAYIKFDYLDGIRNDDSAALNRNAFLLIYDMLNHAHVNASPMLHPDSIQVWSDSLAQADTLTLSSICYQYGRFKPDALTNNLIAYADSQLYDVPGRTESPYYQDTVVATTLMSNTHPGTTVPIRLLSEWQFSNLSSTPVSYELDAKDGQGWQTIPPGVTLMISYPDTGLYFPTFRMTFNNGQQLLAQTRLEITLPGFARSDWLSSFN